MRLPISLSREEILQFLKLLFIYTLPNYQFKNYNYILT